MTGQSTQRPAARTSERAAQPPAQRGPRSHGHGSAAGDQGSPGQASSGQRAGGPPAAARRGHSHGAKPATQRGALLRGRLARPQAGWVLLALPVLGALVDEVSGAPLGGFFLVCSVLASAWAALLSTRRGLWWVLPSPPLVIAAVSLVDQVLLHSSDFAGSKLGTGLLKWSVDLFPTMFFALLAAFAAPALRQALLRRSAARAAGQSAQVPVPRRSHRD